MLCRFVFALWWSVFVWGVWTHLRQPMHVWVVDRHVGHTVSVSRTLRPLFFANASVLWLDMLKDSVRLDLDIVDHVDIGKVGMASGKMLVFEDSFRDTVMEEYDLALTNVSLKEAHIDLMQDDIHLSPFRRVKITPSVEWTLGGSDVTDMERVGYFKDGKWYEGRDATQVGFAALSAWCMGIMFLVIMRRQSQGGTVVVRRKKRIFKRVDRF